MKTVYYGAGHGGNNSTPGKRSPSGEYEWDFNNQVAKGFKEGMSKYSGVKVVRVDDKSGQSDVSLRTRTNQANNANADFYISFHANAHEGVWGDHTGTEAYYYEGNSKMQELAAKLSTKVAGVLGIRDRGAKTANLHITRETKMDALLLESAFMDSNIDIKKLRDSKLLRKAGEAAADVIAEHLGLKKGSSETKPEPKPTPPKPAGKSIDQLVKETLRGDHGNGDARKKSLGKNYKAVQDRINAQAVPTKKKFKGVETLAREVIDGKHGTGEARKKSLGSRYGEVQKRVNQILGVSNKKSINQLVRETLRGDHGNGAQRRRSLGSDYTAVQKAINNLPKK